MFKQWYGKSPSRNFQQETGKKLDSANQELT